MLTLQESQLLLKYLKFWSKLYVVPFHVSINTGKLVEFSQRKLTTWRILYFLAILLSLYGLVVVIYTLILQQYDVNLFHLVVQYDVVLLPNLFHPTVVYALVSNYQNVQKLFNELYNESVGCQGCRRWTKLNITELLAIGIAVLVTGALIFYFSTICIFPTMAHLLINGSFLKSYGTDILIRLLTYCAEVFLLAVWIVNVGFLMSMNALVIAKMEQELNDSLVKLREPRYVDNATLQGACKKSRRVQLYLQMYNGLNAWFVHAYKTTTMVGAIIHGYIGVRFTDHILIPVFCTFVHIAAVVAYCGVMQRAYQVARGQMDVKREITAASYRVRNLAERWKLLREVKSLRCEGLQVGKFHEIERNSSVLYMDFVERQLIGLLLAF